MGGKGGQRGRGRKGERMRGKGRKGREVLCSRNVQLF